jgi:TonB family protein
MTNLAWLICLTGLLAPQDTVKFIPIPRFHVEKPSEEFINIVPPELVSKPETKFPTDPQLQYRTARVYVGVLVDSAGHVRQAKVLNSTDGDFDKYALALAKRYKFKASSNDSRPKTLWVSIPFFFKH